MEQVKTTQGLRHGLYMKAYFELLRLLASHGVPASALTELCLSLAESARTADTVPTLNGEKDILARQFEDMASRLQGGDMMPRDE